VPFELVAPAPLHIHRSSLVEDDPIVCHSERSEESPHLKASIDWKNNAGMLRCAQHDRLKTRIGHTLSGAPQGSG